MTATAGGSATAWRPLAMPHSTPHRSPTKCRCCYGRCCYCCFRRRGCVVDAHSCIGGCVICCYRRCSLGIPMQHRRVNCCLRCCVCSFCGRQRPQCDLNAPFCLPGDPFQPVNLPYSSPYTPHRWVLLRALSLTQYHTSNMSQYIVREHPCCLGPALFTPPWFIGIFAADSPAADTAVYTQL